MVSSALEMELDDLVAALKRIGETCGNDPEYRKLRAPLPADWPL